MPTPAPRQEIHKQARLWYQQSSERKRVTAAAAMIAVGIFFIYLATEGAGIVVGLAGFVAVAAGIYPVKDLVQEPSKSKTTRKFWLAAGLAVVVLGCGIVWLAVTASQAWLAAIGALVVILGLLPLGAYQRVDSKRSGIPLTIAGLLVVVFAALAVPLDGIKLNWLLALALILIGITVYRTGLTGWLTEDRTVRLAAIVGLIGVVVGTVLVCLGGQLANLWLFIAGALPGTLALHLLSVASTSAPATDWKDATPAWKAWSRWAHLAAGAVAAATWVSLWSVAQQPFWLGTATAIGLFSMGAAFVWRGESVLLVLLCGFLVVWVTIDRTEPPLEDPPDGAPRIVAIGDSFMSGDGAPRYYEHTDVAGSKRNTCRRAPTAYPVLVAEALDLDLQFLACSGAETKNLWNPKEGQMPDATDDAPGRLPQLDYVTSVHGVEFVLVSIGGNDANFKSVGTGCLLPGTCSDLENSWIKNAEGITEDTVVAFEQVRARFGADIPVIALAYPIVIREETCSDVMLTSEEHEFLVRFTETINAQAQLAAAQAGIHFFEGTADAFVGDKLCSQDELSPASVNFLAVQPPKGPLLDRLNPARWIHQSMHPNPTGHGRMAAALISWLQTSPPGDNPLPNPRATLENLSITVRPAQAGSFDKLPDDDEWRNEQLAHAAREAWPIVVVLFLGGWAFAFTSNHGGPFHRPSRMANDA